MSIVEKSPRCPDCGMPVPSIFEHIVGCPDPDYVASATYIIDGEDLIEV